MQLGFVIDHSRCIGCHACTVACKSENDVPLGNFRTWVKYTETGEFPEVRRSFGVLRCNQCTEAPCVEICPVSALEKRPDGIVDVDPSVCIGCKACMQGCPYDALYLNDSKGTAEKCHFCAHRVEVGLAPACAVVCPTEAIIPGDFDDPGSVVSKMRGENELEARKVEAGTSPNVFYKRAHDSVLDPQQTNGSGGYIWANQSPGLRVDTETFESMEDKAQSRTVYDVERPLLWGAKVSSYLFTKSIAAGVLIAGLFAPATVRVAAWTTGLAVFFLMVTTVLLVWDLKRPERFLLILRRPNLRSWLARGSYILIGYGGALGLWLFLLFVGVPPASVPGRLFSGIAVLGAVLSAIYTAWLFRQSKGRPLWMKRWLAPHLLVQALVAGSGLVLVVHPLLDLGGLDLDWVRFLLQGSLLLHLGAMLVEGRLAPAKREREYHRAARVVARGPFAMRHWIVGVGIGVFAAMMLAAVPVTGGASSSWAWIVAGLAALVGLFVEEDLYVRAGQAIPIS